MTVIWIATGTFIGAIITYIVMERAADTLRRRARRAFYHEGYVEGWVTRHHGIALKDDRVSSREIDEIMGTPQPVVAGQPTAERLKQGEIIELGLRAKEAERANSEIADSHT